MKDFIKKRENIIYVVIVVFLTIIVNMLYGTAVVNGDSMLNTYRNGNTILFDKNIYKITGLERGDIIITNEGLEGLDKKLVKRIIGLPGELVTIKGNKVYINNTELKEDYIKEDMETVDLEIKLKEDEYFIMGDNRNDSLDSRGLGAINIKYIYGKALIKFNTDFKTKLDKTNR